MKQRPTVWYARRMDIRSVLNILGGADLDELVDRRTS